VKKLLPGQTTGPEDFDSCWLEKFSELSVLLVVPDSVLPTAWYAQVTLPNSVPSTTVAWIAPLAPVSVRVPARR
jgi:hypothetical protein